MKTCGSCIRFSADTRTCMQYGSERFRETMTAETPGCFKHLEVRTCGTCLHNPDGDMCELHQCAVGKRQYCTDWESWSE